MKFHFFTETWKSHSLHKNIFYINSNDKCFLSTKSAYYNYFWSIMRHWRLPIQLCHHRNKWKYIKYKYIKMYFKILFCHVILSTCYSFVILFTVSNVCVNTVEQYKTKFLISEYCKGFFFFFKIVKLKQLELLYINVLNIVHFNPILCKKQKQKIYIYIFNFGYQKIHFQNWCSSITLEMKFKMKVVIASSPQEI